MWTDFGRLASGRTCSRAPNPHSKCCDECPNPKWTRVIAKRSRVRLATGEEGILVDYTQRVSPILTGPMENPPFQPTGQARIEIQCRVLLADGSEVGAAEDELEDLGTLVPKCDHWLECGGFCYRALDHGGDHLCAGDDGVAGSCPA